MAIRRVFRDWMILVVASSFNQKRFEELLTTMGITHVRTTDADTRAPIVVRQLKPNIVMVDRNLKILNGMQVMSAIRQDNKCDDVPFLVVGDKDDLKPGGLGDRLEADDKAQIVIEPLTVERIEEALTVLMEQFVDHDKESALGMVDEAKKAVKEDDHDKAARYYGRANEKYKDNPSILIGLGESLTKLERHEEAEKAFRQAMEIDPENLRAIFGLVELMESQNKFDDAVELLHGAQNLAGRLAASGTQQSRISFYIGEFDLKLVKLEEARDAFQKAIEFDPNNGDLQADIGDAYLSNGYPDDAAIYYEGALEINPDLAHVFNRLGMTYRSQHKFDTAVEVYRKALKLHPKDENLLFNIARTLDEAGRREEAMAALEKAAKLAPKMREVKALMASLKADQASEEKRLGLEAKKKRDIDLVKTRGDMARKKAEDASDNRRLLRHIDKLAKQRRLTQVLQDR